MEKLLPICGIMVLILPLLFKETYFGKLKVYRIVTQVIGIFMLLVGVLFRLGTIESNNVLFIVLFGAMLIWNLALFLSKIKNDHGPVSVLMSTVCGILILLSVLLFISDRKEVASSILLLIGSLIVVTI